MKTFALVAYILLGNGHEAFVVDSGLTEQDCLIESEELKWIELSPGLEIRVDADEVEGLMCEVE